MSRLMHAPASFQGMISRRIPSRGQLRRLSHTYDRAHKLRTRGYLWEALKAYEQVMEALGDQLADAVEFWLGGAGTIEDVSLDTLITVIKRAIGHPAPRLAEEKVLWGLMTGVFSDAASTTRQLSIARGCGRNEQVAAGVMQAAAAAIIVNPWHAAAPHNLGRFLHYLGDADSAQAFLAAAVVLDESQCEAWRYLGEFLGGRGDRAALEECRDKAARCRMRSADDHYNMSLSYLSRGDYATGWQLYERRRECPDLIYLYGRPDLPWPTWTPDVEAAA